MGEPNIYSLVAQVADEPYDELNFYFETRNKGTEEVVNPQVLSLVIPNATPDWADAGTADDITDVLEVLLGLTAGSLAL